MAQMIEEKRLRDTIDRSEIINLISKSIITRDSGRWDELAECYHSEAEFTSSWWKGKPSDFFKVASEKLEESRRAGGEQKHVTSNQWIEIAGERATAESDLILFMRDEGPERGSPYDEGHAIFINQNGDGFRNVGHAAGINSNTPVTRSAGWGCWWD